MKTIRHTTTLFYYDGPQVFEARDTIGGHYVAVMVEPKDGLERYLVVGVAPERLRQFRAGTLDLRSLLAESGEEEWYLAATTAGLDQPLALVPQRAPLMESGLLPDTGFVLHDRPTEELVLREARVGNCGGPARGSGGAPNQGWHVGWSARPCANLGEACLRGGLARFVARYAPGD